MPGSSNTGRGLGKGLGSLIPTDFDQSLLVEAGERIQKLLLSDVHPSAEQPRTIFDDTALSELAASIRQYGIVQPLVVSADDHGYEIIAGERRWRAAKLAGLKTVPCIVRTTEQQERLELALVENVQRVDLSPLEQAASMERLHTQFNLSYDDIAKRVGKGSSTVVNIIRLLQLPEAARQALVAGTITEGHARQILALKGMTKEQSELLKHVIEHGWTVRQAERFVLSLKEGAKTVSEAKTRMALETTETKRLTKRYGTKVQIRRTAHGGKIEIGFTDDTELQRILSDLER